MLVQVSIAKNVFGKLTYNYKGDPEDVKPGTRVVVPVGKRIETGWVFERNSDYRGKVRDIFGVVEDRYFPDKNHLGFAEPVSGIYFCSPGMILEYSLSPKRRPVNSLFCLSHEKAVNLKKFSFEELLEISSDEPVRFFYKGTECSL